MTNQSTFKPIRNSRGKTVLFFDAERDLISVKDGKVIETFDLSRYREPAQSTLNGNDVDSPNQSAVE